MLRPIQSSASYPELSHPMTLHAGPELQTRIANRPGLDFVTQDYLGLATHPAVLAAHQSVPVVGDTLLNQRLASFLQVQAAQVFASGTEAIRAALAGLLGHGDDIIIDTGAHPAMFVTATAAGATLHRSPAGSLRAMERRLSRLGRLRRTGALYVAVSAISAHGSRMADLAELSSLARRHGARLIVDVSHDLGAMGPTGRGVMEAQGCLGQIDILVGSLGKCFGGSGGVAAFRDLSLYKNWSQGQRHNAPIAGASTLLAALDMVDSKDGLQRRRLLRACTLRLRNHLMADGVRVTGDAAPFVLVPLPVLTALPRTALLESAGPRIGLLHTPQVGAHAPRWRIHLTANHSPADIDDLAELIRDVTRVFDRKPRPHPAEALIP